MTAPSQPLARRIPRRWLRLPRRTVRLRLTVVYGALFLLSGAALLAVTYVLVARNLPTAPPLAARARSLPAVMPARITTAPAITSGPQERVFIQKGADCHLTTGSGTSPAQAMAQARQCLDHLRAIELNQLLTESGTALAIMTVVSVGLGWLVAGRVLGKLRTITAAARSISASSLHARLALAGPDDELRELGDTFDGLLARLEASFGAQRQFVANASHELRTPLARQRTLVEVALADPQPSVARLQDVCRRVLAAGEEQEDLIEALLTLARGQRGLDRREPIDLAAITGEVMLARQAEVYLRGLEVTASLCPAPAPGDARLAERLVANLVSNAIRHNVADGTIQVATAVWAGHAVLSVSNTGPVVAPGQVSQLFQPFHRGGTDRTGPREGLGLGLSIVAAIADAHGAWLQAHARSGGGLTVSCGFPQAKTPLQDATRARCPADPDDLVSGIPTVAV
ncbi:MAG TPA: HAMP domain-containing sensor histidine kinase [Streptosporangiaceae bacterium]|nr:HAMP domain-containing sensor histidine kinase [Streptosporangiaceae bacterium]